MERQSVDSSMIRALGYDAAERTLEVEFNNGALYQYPCDPDLYNDFCCSPSKGRFFIARIKPLGCRKVSA